jgi:hypothetical protein
MGNLIRLIAAAVVAVSLTSGCAINRATATVDPSANLPVLKTMHVVKQDRDGRGVNVLIADNLRARGFAVTTGADKPTGKDAMVTYTDKWIWDITMYMLELTIVIRDPKNDYPLATGNSYHTSLTRLSPTDMVREVLDNIFKGGK